MTLRTIGKYELLEELGRGGFAVVHKARDTTLDRVVALKVLRPQWADDAQFVTRFRQEARAAANLRHPNIVTIHEASEADGQFYIAMEYLPGRTLHDLLEEQGPLSLEGALPILEQLADALDYAHAQGVIHRDIKPANVMVEGTASGPHVTLMDFGLVKALESNTALTSQGTLLGSPEYMAPEQADLDRKDEIGPATDRYALGIVAYQMLTGRVPFSGNMQAILYAHIITPPPDPQRFVTDLSSEVTDVLLTMLAKAPKHRFPTASAFVARFREKKSPERQSPAVPQLFNTPPPLTTQSQAIVDQISHPISGLADTPAARAQQTFASTHTIEVYGRSRRGANAKWQKLGSTPGSVALPPNYVLGLRFFNFGLDELETWIKEIPHPDDVVSLDLNGPIDDAGMATLRAFPNLTYLEVDTAERVTNAGLAYLVGLPKLTTLHFPWATGITDEGMAYLRALPELAGLLLHWAGISDAALRYLESLAKLSVLELRECKHITGSGLLYLRAVPNLTVLDLAGASQFNDTGLQAIGPCTGLAKLDLSRCPQITYQGIVHLRNLFNLTYLDLSKNPKVDDKGVLALCNLQSLATLNLAGTSITDVGLSHISDIPGLLYLDLSHCEYITDRGLSYLHRLKKLTYLNVSECKDLTSPGISKLSRPDLHIKQYTQLQATVDQPVSFEQETLQQAAEPAKLEQLLLSVLPKFGRIKFFAAAVLLCALLVLFGTLGPRLWGALFTTATPTPERYPLIDTPIPTPTPTTTPTATPTPVCDSQGCVGDDRLHPQDSMRLVYVPGGTFQMGSETGDSVESPVHSVTLSGFWIYKMEVTNALYAKCVTDGICMATVYADNADFNGDQQPAVGVDWNNAVAYCSWAEAQLPTEAQWEYAARGPEGYTYPWGNTLDGINPLSRSGSGKVHPEVIIQQPVIPKPKTQTGPAVDVEYARLINGTDYFMVRALGLEPGKQASVRIQNGEQVLASKGVTVDELSSISVEFELSATQSLERVDIIIVSGATQINQVFTLPSSASIGPLFTKGTLLNFCDVNCATDGANKDANDEYEYTAPVGSFPEGISWVGALDMAGNVWEWTADRLDAYPAESQINPEGPTTGGIRVIRGGSWSNDISKVRSTNRGANLPTYASNDVGFRCVVVYP